MAKEERIGNTRKKLWQEGNSNSKTKGTFSAQDLVISL